MDDDQSRNLGNVAPLAAALAVIIVSYAGIALVLGWGLHIDLLIRHPSTKTAMVPASAVGFLLSGCALLAASRNHPVLARLCLMGVLGVVMVAFIGQTVGWQWSAGMFFHELAMTDRMAPATAVGFALAAFGTDRFMKEDYFSADAAGIFGLSSAVGLFLLNFTGVSPELGIAFLSGMSLQSSALFTLFFLALCLTSQMEKPEAD